MLPLVRLIRSSNSLRFLPRYSLSSSKSSTRCFGARNVVSWRSWAWRSHQWKSQGCFLTSYLSQYLLSCYLQERTQNQSKFGGRKWRSIPEQRLVRDFLFWNVMKRWWLEENQGSHLGALPSCISWSEWFNSKIIQVKLSHTAITLLILPLNFPTPLFFFS